MVIQTLKINKWIEFTILEKNKQVLYKNIIANLPNGDDSE